MNALKNKINNLSTAKIIETYNATSEMKITIELAEVRGVLQDELEKRNPEAFENWMLCDDVEKCGNPANFF